jgi:hypothetical protein
MARLRAIGTAGGGSGWSDSSVTQSVLPWRQQMREIGAAERAGLDLAYLAIPSSNTSRLGVTLVTSRRKAHISGKKYITLSAPNGHSARRTLFHGM